MSENGAGSNGSITGGSTHMGSTAALVSRLRQLAAQGSGAADAGEVEHCDLCGTELDADHRHLLHIEERRILCACEPCVAMRIADGPYRPTGTRVLWLDDFAMPDDLWARLQIPIGLAFFMLSSSVDGVAGLYPSPAGATECELDLVAWEELCEQNPVLRGLERDAEALIVDRISDSHRYVIAPIDECYRLVGLVKANWEGISGGDAVERAVPEFFAELYERSPSRRGG